MLSELHFPNYQQASRLLVISILFVSSESLQADDVFKSVCVDKRYTVTVTDQVLSRSTEWRIEKETPPVSFERAVRLAGEKKAKLVEDTRRYRWGIESVQLRRRGQRWYWLVEYETRALVDSVGLPFTLRLVVLMNGTVVEPKDVSPGARLEWEMSIEKELTGSLAEVLQALSDLSDIPLLVNREEFAKAGHGEIERARVRLSAKTGLKLKSVLEELFAPVRVTFRAHRDYLEIIPAPNAKVPKLRPTRE